MKLVKFSHNGSIGEGVVDGDIIRVVGALSAGPAEVKSFTLSYQTRDALEALLTESNNSLPLSEVTLEVPIDPLRKIICVGMNYRDHTKEIKYTGSGSPVLFIRSQDSIVAHYQHIMHPGISETYDFEGEIAIVIGKSGRHIAVDDAMPYVSGYSCFMDGSVREYQKHSVTAGKNYWRSGAMGPWVVTADEIGDSDISLQTRVNGEVVQAASISQLIFDIPAIINYVSRVMHLQPGDVIATGTPGGVGSRRTPPLWLRAGDLVEVEVAKVGCLQNRVQAAE